MARIVAFLSNRANPGPTSPVSRDWSGVGSASSLTFIYCPSLSGHGQQDKFKRYRSRVSSFASFILGEVDKLKKRPAPRSLI